jgi:hypothetical protein
METCQLAISSRRHLITCLAILAGYDPDQERASWQDGEGGRLERFVQEIAVEVVTSAEISYLDSCVRAFEWRVRRKAGLVEEIRNRQLQLEREELERRQRLEQARIDRLLDEAESLRKAMDIRMKQPPNASFKLWKLRGKRAANRFPNRWIV